MTTFSAYTIASNCCDLTDIGYGIDELRAYLNTTGKPCQTATIRFARLMAKRDKFISKAK